jgi:nitrogen fixation-related uncharacterized protein
MEVTLEYLWAAWIVTLVVVGLIVWLILWAVKARYATLSWGVVLFVAGLLAAIAVFCGANYLDATDFTTGQQVAFYILLALAVIVPLVGIFMIFWRGETKCFSDCDPCKEEKKMKEVVTVSEVTTVKQITEREIVPVEKSCQTPKPACEPKPAADPKPACIPCARHKVAVKTCGACVVGV